MAPGAPVRTQRQVQVPRDARDNNGLKARPKPSERSTWTFLALSGYTCRVLVRGGVAYEGVFHGAALDGPDTGLTLRMARVVEGRPAADAVSEPGLPTGWHRLLRLPLGDVVQLTASDVRLGAEDLGGMVANDELVGFGTDAAISRGRGGMVGRELKRWEPSADDAPLEGLEDARSGDGARGSSWDQFALNRSKFGVQTTFQEDLYTTKLDKGKSRISEAEAARLAAEIMQEARSGGPGAAAANAHLAEERGMEADDSAMDEEDKYSSVLRAPAVGGPPPARPMPISNGSASSAGAWRNAGSSIAAISGRNSAAAGTPSSGPRPIPGRSAAIDMPTSPVDTRREYNKVAMQMGAPVRTVATSPYGTPKGARSPLSSSPLVHDAAAMEALNLNPGAPRVDHRARAAFEEFKAREAADKAKRERDELREKLRTFSQDGGKPPSSTSASETAPSPSERATPLADAATATSPPPPTNGKAATAAVAAAPSPVATAQAANSSTPGDQGAAAAGQPPTPSSATSASSKLNPFAKSFSFNPGAKEFKPGPSSGSGGNSLSSASMPGMPPSARRASGGGNGSHGGRPPHSSGNPLSRGPAPPPRGSHSRNSSSGSGLALPPGAMMPGGLHQRMGSGQGLPPMGLPPGMHLPGAPPPHMERTGSGAHPPGPGMAPIPMPMQGGAPVQMPQGMYIPQQGMYGPPVMMPGSPGQFMMYPGGPRPQFVNVMPPGYVMAYPPPGGPSGSPGGPPPAGMRPQMYQAGPPPQFPGGPHPGGPAGFPPPGVVPGHPSQPMGPPQGPFPQQHPVGHAHSHSRSSSFGGLPPGGPPGGLPPDAHIGPPQQPPPDAPR